MRKPLPSVYTTNQFFSNLFSSVTEWRLIFSIGVCVITLGQKDWGSRGSRQASFPPFHSRTHMGTHGVRFLWTLIIVFLTKWTSTNNFYITRDYQFSHTWQPNITEVCLEIGVGNHWIHLIFINSLSNFTFIIETVQMNSS